MELCRQPVSAYLERFGFRSDLLKAMYAVTDGVSGLTATWDMPGSGLNFLCHNMVQPFLKGSDLGLPMLDSRSQGLRGLLEGHIAALMKTYNTLMGVTRTMAKKELCSARAHPLLCSPDASRCSCPHGRVAKLKDCSCCGARQCRLPGAEGTWMVVRGGMGTVTSQLAQANPRPSLPAHALQLPAALSGQAGWASVRVLSVWLLCLCKAVVWAQGAKVCRQ